VAYSTSPIASRATIAVMKAYVGSANRSPDSRTPRRFASTITARHASDRPTRCELSEGANDVIAKIPAEIDTATVRT